MNALVGLLFTAAVLAVAGAGFATMAGVPTLRTRFFGIAIVTALVAIGIPPVLTVLGSTARAAVHGVEESAGDVGGFPTWIFVVMGLGYVAAAVAFVRIPRQPALRRERDAERERARSRQRRRMPPRGEGL
jgi:hypothetical protein